jgi:murein L,D-transpeptidase YafK
MVFHDNRPVSSCYPDIFGQSFSILSSTEYLSRIMPNKTIRKQSTTLIRRAICHHYSAWFGFIVLWIILIAVRAEADADSADRWILIDTRHEKLTVMDHTGAIDIFDNIAFGVRGAGVKLRRGDEITPQGSFSVGWISRQSRFHAFIGLNYPNMEHARLAYYDGRINETTYRIIHRALAQGKPPPQKTALGGYIGIHGIGNGDPFIHENINWTNGCVALTNQQIDRLLTWVKVGTRVEIR